MAFKIESSLLEACALAILSRGDTYGYEITQSMKRAIVISESTLYPVLRRLQKEELCRTYDEPFQGRNRRYYTITAEGKKKLKEYQTQWKDYKTAIETFLGEEGSSAAGTQSGKGKPAEQAETAEKTEPTEETARGTGGEKAEDGGGENE